MAYAVWQFWTVYFQLSEAYLTIFSAVCLIPVCWRLFAIPKYIYCLSLKKINPSTSLDSPRSFQEAEAPRIQENRHIKMASLCGLLTGRLYPQEKFLVLISVRGWVGPWDIGQQEKSSDAIGNQKRDLPACSAGTQSTVPPRALCAVLVPFAKQLKMSVSKAVRVVMPARILVPLRETGKRTWRIFVKFQTWDFYKNFPSHSDLIKIRQK